MSTSTLNRSLRRHHGSLTSLLNRTVRHLLPQALWGTVSRLFSGKALSSKKLSEWSTGLPGEAPLLLPFSSRPSVVTATTFDLIPRARWSPWPTGAGVEATQQLEVPFNPKEQSVTFNSGLDSIKCRACGTAQIFISPPFCKRCKKSLGIQYAILTLTRETSIRRNPRKGWLGHSDI